MHCTTIIWAEMSGITIEIWAVSSVIWLGYGWAHNGFSLRRPYISALNGWENVRRDQLLTEIFPPLELVNGVGHVGHRGHSSDQVLFVLVDLGGILFWDTNRWHKVNARDVKSRRDALSVIWAQLSALDDFLVPVLSKRNATSNGDVMCGLGTTSGQIDKVGNASLWSRGTGEGAQVSTQSLWRFSPSPLAPYPLRLSSTLCPTTKPGVLPYPW